VWEQAEMMSITLVDETATKMMKTQTMSMMLLLHMKIKMRRKRSTMRRMRREG
jgi:hypothetical protein